jgi:pyridoxamine 5'-phosphate oxidase
VDLKEVLDIIDFIINDAKAAVLATTGKDGVPHMRWMTPAVLQGKPGAVYAVTSPKFQKIKELEKNASAVWMFQTRALDQIMSVKGMINVIDNPSLKAEILESLGKRLSMFWKVSENEMDFVVLETVIEEATYFQPMRGLKQTVRFR